MGERSFLFSLCDYQYNLSGCSNLESFVLVQRVFAGLHVGSALFCLIAPLKTVYDGMAKEQLPLRRAWNDYCWNGIGGTVVHLMIACYCVFLTRISGLDLAAMANDDIVAYTKSNIVFDFFILILAGVSASVGMLIVVKMAVGANLYDEFEFRGMKVNPAILMRGVRIFITVWNVICVSLWATLGLQSLNQYFLFKRMIFLCLGIPISLLNVSVFCFCGFSILDRLKKSKKSVSGEIRIKMFSMILYILPLAGYLPFSIQLVGGLVVATENFQGNHRVLLYTSIVAKSLAISSSTITAVYNLFIAFKKPAKSNSDRNESKEKDGQAAASTSNGGIYQSSTVYTTTTTEGGVDSTPCPEDTPVPATGPVDTPSVPDTTENPVPETPNYGGGGQPPAPQPPCTETPGATPDTPAGNAPPSDYLPTATGDTPGSQPPATNQVYSSASSLSGSLLSLLSIILALV
ncbi:hypothetical protein HDU91_007419 [Kappamyces sp. JEL0680]|nr:hypothetical protein HDU91_007419 [Kappamyces sp. JEL0680]